MKSSVCQTAIDAARSKRSAAEHYDIGGAGCNNSRTVVRQQTPLLHWGYATRMQCMWSRLHASVAQLDRLQLVILGPGLDRTGFRLLSAFPGGKIQSLLEVDLGPICTLKRTELTDTNRDETLSIRNANTSDEEPQDGSLVLQGQYHQAVYTLVALDLNGDENMMRSLFDKHLLEDDTPVLVVSELVVSYLQPASCDAVLSYFGHRPHCSILLYEALGGASAEEKKESLPSVADAYRTFYHDQFRSKLQRGNAHTAAAAAAAPLFHPLGTSLVSVQERLEGAGFSATRVVHPTISSPCTQLFDEHAAMALHLQTYVIAAAATAQHLHNHRWFQQALQGDTVVDVVPTTITTTTTSYHKIAPALPVDAPSLRNGFADTYTDCTSPSIPKLVQAVLRTDFAPDDIASHYRRHLGGNYWVCCGIADADGGATTRSTAIVLGGVGLRRRSVAEPSVVLRPPSSSAAAASSVVWGMIPCYEIQRVFVSDGHRGHGIGRALIEQALAYVRQTGYPRCHVVAVTLSILEAAHRLYLAMGFRAVDRTTKGDLTYVTYWKEVVATSG